MATIARGLVIGALTPMLLAAACTPEPVAPASPTPSVSASPSETNAERQMRLDWEAAEKAYRDGVAELGRLSRAGAKSPSAELERVSSGSYLRLQAKALSYLGDRDWRLSGAVVVEGVRPVGGWTETTLRLVACENNQGWRFVDKESRDVSPKQVDDYIQTLAAAKVGGSWRIDSVQTRRVRRLTGGECR